MCNRRPAYEGDAAIGIMPFMCSAAAGLRASGEHCLGDSDCASGTCEAEQQLKLCDAGGRRCEQTSDCPWADWLASCVTLGADDGVCQ